MSLLDNQTRVSVGAYFPALSGGGGAGGVNIVASTITLEGPAPITATLPSAPNDGFEVRNGGGGGNVVVIATMDENNTGQAEFGIRTLSTIGGSASVVGRFEMSMDGLPTDLARIGYTLDKAVSGTPSTIGTIDFKPGTAPLKGTVVVSAEDATAMTVGNANVIVAPTGTAVVPLKATVLGGGNLYVPAAGTNTPVAQFSTIAGHAYEVWVPSLRIQNQPAGAPAAGAWSALYVDTTAATYLDTFDMASVSSIANSLQKSPAYAFIATGAAHSIIAQGLTTNTLSTAITISPAQILLRDLGAPASMTLDG